MITTTLHNDVLEIVLTNPPVNALAHGVRSALLKAITEAQTDESVKAIVIRGDGRMFSAGADISEFSKPLVEQIGRAHV